MTPQRLKTYCWLFAAMSASVCINLLMMQPRHEAGVSPAAAPAKAMRVGGSGESRSADQITDTVRAIQREMKELNLYPGQVDGKPSLLLSAAVMAYEQAQTLPMTGEPSQALLRDLIVGPVSSGGTAAIAGITPGSAAERVVKDVRQKLIGLGYAVGGTEGRMTLDLIQAIRAFERDANMPQTGRISANLVLQLQRSTVAFKQR